MSLAYLHHRLRRGVLVDNQFGISNEDLAMDCIAELFQRNDTGHFLIIDQYFTPLNWSTLSEEDLKIALRRLVFSKVNESLFRSYREEDPNLAKIIRNIKEALKNQHGISLVKFREASWLIVGDADTEVNGKPLAPQEILEAHLLDILCNTSNTYKAASSFIQFVELHPHYCNAYPISGFAQALRTAFSARTVPESQEANAIFEAGEIDTAIQKAVAYIRTTLHETYVLGGKLSQKLFDTYVVAINKVLRATFTRTEEHVDSQYDALVSLMPGLSKDVYMSQHRNILQYLFKLSRSRMIFYLQDD